MKLLRLIIYITLANSWLAIALPSDSIGVEKKNGKNYVKHKVESGETLYRLSKRYGASVDDIKAENPDVEKGFKEGMTLLIPYAKKSGAASKPTEPVKTTESSKLTEKPVSKPSGDAKTHTVENGQGLYAISKLYKVSVEDIKKWNNLSSNDVKVGQVLVVSASSAESKLNTGNNVSTNTTGATNKQDDAPTITKSVTTNRVVATTTGPNPVNRKILDTLRVVAFKKNDGPSQKNFHNGAAMVSTDPSNADKFEAYYDNVPVGSFINVKSLFNEEKVFLKVVGKLPKQADPKIILSITPRALERLQCTDAKLAVEVSYIAP